jgi:sugar transferase (PEP-CTERM/EpsH1 system associated)
MHVKANGTPGKFSMQIETQSETVNAALSATPGAPRVGGERLRVLHVIACLGMGGTEHGVLKVLNGLGEERFEHRICAVRGIDAGFAHRMHVTGQVYCAGSPTPGFQFPLFRLTRIMNEFRPHIVHTRNFGALEAIPAARLAGVPVAIHSEHGYELEILSGLPLRRRILCRAFYNMADAVFTVTEDLRAYHAKQSWLRAEKLQVIYNGVNTEHFCPRPDTAHLRHELQIPQDRIVIGSVGRLVPIKDHYTLLLAAESLLRERNNVHVLLIGGGPELAKLQAYAVASPELTGRVTFTGSSDRIPEMLNAMDIFVLPSICEGMSNTILEAMASGLPVVVTSAGGNPELVDDGRVGWLFAPRDTRALAHQLDRLVRDGNLRHEFGAAARQRAVQRFSLTAMIEAYRGLYLDLAARRGAWTGN